LSRAVLAHGPRQDGFAGEANVIRIEASKVMAFAEIELARIEKSVGGFCSRRTNPAIRDELRLEYSVYRHDIELFEVRRDWRDPAEEMQSAVAKIKYVRTTNEWRLYWMRQDLKWHSYEPHPVGKSLEELVAVVDQDQYCCFFG
jgi:hypothetical protein